MRKRVITTAVCLVAAIVAVLLAAILSVKKSRPSTGTSPRDSNKNSEDRYSQSHKGRDHSELSASESGSNSSSGSGLGKDDLDELPNPLNETYATTALAIGDWGRTSVKEGGSCCSRRKAFTVLDFNAMEYTATLLGLVAQELDPRPSVVISHGDNFYWTGLQSVNDQAYRFQQTFEEKYSDAALAGIPWITVLGNHDYGGASYICSSGDEPAPCLSASDLLEHLNQKFALQSQYVSPNADRWHMPDHFYVHSLQDANGVTVDVFNLDTNDADSHGARQICCQCYGYSGGDDDQCEDVVRGQQQCAGGDTGLYDVCMKQLKEWADDSRQRLVEAAKASNATWKIVNTHYSPYNHYAPNTAEEWRQLLVGLGVQLFMYGHTHGEKHDYATYGTHFVENGAGGGIQNESPSGIPPAVTNYVENVWAAGGYPYGVFSLRASPEWLQIKFLSFDDQWVMKEDLSASVVGGVKEGHCWFIPQRGGRGASCAEAEKHATVA
jgi:tartrate-resistant acid phosphatase type 5